MDQWTPPNNEFPAPKPGEPAIHRAARLGDADELRRLASEGEDLDSVFDIALAPRDYSYCTPLMVAAGSGDGADVATVHLLLDLGADPAIVCGTNSAASMAVRGLGWNYRPGGDIDRLKLLLDAGSPVAGDTYTANRILCDAAGFGNIEMVKALTDYGLDRSCDWDTADQQLASFSFEIPLFTAAESGSKECVQHLLQIGVNPLRRDNSGRTALYYAGSLEVVRLLVDSGLPLEDEDEYGWSPLTNAVGDGMDSFDRIKWLVEAGANVNGTHDRGYTVFMTAVSSSERNVEILRFLVESGANPHSVSELGYNAFHASIDVNGPDANTAESIRSVMRYLKSLRVDINRKNQSGNTPLALARLRGTKLEYDVLKELGGRG